MAVRQKKSLSPTASFSPLLLLKVSGVGAALGILFTILLLVLLALLMTVRDIPHAFVEPLAVTVTALGSLAGGLAAAKLLGEKGMVAGACCGVLVAFLVILLSLLVDSFGFGVKALLRLATILLASAVGGVIGVNLRKKSR